MDKAITDQLYAEGLLSESSFQKINAQPGIRLFSLHWEIRLLLYLGILLLTGGLGILVYKNIDSIGHEVVLISIALLSAGSFLYCFKNKLPFSSVRVKAPNAFFDYILLLGCLTFITFIAYFQYQYNIFGNRFGLATFFPMVILFFSAYYFDHLGILSLAITNLAAWLGITVTPLHILQSNNFNSNVIICTGVLLGIFLIIVGWVSVRRNFKQHFQLTYTNFGMHILFISILAGMLLFEKGYVAWFIFLLAVAYFFYTRAGKEKSFYILLISTLYAYTGMSYIVIRLLSASESFGTGLVYTGLIYFIASAAGLLVFLMRTNKKLKHDSI